MTYVHSSDVFNNVYDRTLKAIRITDDGDTLAVIGDTYEADESASVGVMSSVIFASVDLLAYSTKCFTIKNEGSNTIDSISIQSSPNDIDWEDYDTTTFASLGAGVIKSLQLTLDSRRYWRVIASSSAASTSTVWITANSIIKGGAASAFADLVTNETPSGNINGINRVFNTVDLYITGSTRLHKNGVRMDKDVYYTESGAQEITLNEAPIAGDTLIIDYIKS